MGFNHRWEEVGHRTATGGHHGRGTTFNPCPSQRNKGRRAFVIDTDHVQAGLAGGQGQGRTSRARREHHATKTTGLPCGKQFASEHQIVSTRMVGHPSPRSGQRRASHRQLGFGFDKFHLRL